MHFNGNYSIKVLCCFVRCICGTVEECTHMSDLRLCLQHIRSISRSLIANTEGNFHALPEVVCCLEKNCNLFCFVVICLCLISNFCTIACSADKTSHIVFFRCFLLSETTVSRVWTMCRAVACRPWLCRTVSSSSRRRRR